MSDKHPFVGKILADDYQIMSFLGKGGMGTVFVAHQISLNRQVAVKLLPLLSISQEQISRFESEIAAMATLSHPNIVTIHHRDRFGDPPTMYYVMEFLEGGSLKNYLEHYGKLPPSLALRLINQVEEALAYAHEQGFIHRDIKPDNLLFTRNYRCLKVADFGIARLVSGAHITQTESILGTFLYAAPEQMNWYEKTPEENEEKIDTRADQYSLGMVLYEMIAGRLPYQCNNMMQVMKALSQPQIPLSQMAGATIPKSMDWLVATMTATDREKRFPNDEALLEGIASVELEMASTSATRIFALNSSGSFSVAPPDYDTGHGSREERKKMIQNLQTLCGIGKKPLYKNKIVFTFLAISLLLFLTVIGGIWLSAKKKANPDSGTSKVETKPDNGQTSVPEISYVVVEVHPQYDVPPPSEYPPIQVIFVSEKGTKSTKLADRLMPGRYLLSVILPAYSCEEHGKMVTIPATKDFHVTIKLTAIPRKISSRILNLATGQEVDPISLLVDDQIISGQSVLKPGSHQLYAQFKEFADIKASIQIPPGIHVFQFQTALNPLKEIMFACKIDTILPADSLEVFVDGQKLSPVHFQGKIMEGNLYASIKVANTSAKISLKHGFYFSEVLIDQLYLMKGLDSLDPTQMVLYLQQEIKDIVQWEKWMNHFWQQDQEKFQKLSEMEKERIFQFLVQKTPESDYDNMEKPVWFLRALLSAKEGEERGAYNQICIKAQSSDYRNRIELWQEFLNRFSQTAYRKQAQSLLNYNQAVCEYENFIRQSAQDGYVSISEKRSILRKSEKLRQEDVEAVHKAVGAYIKEKCDKTLEEILK